MFIDNVWLNEDYFFEPFSLWLQSKINLWKHGSCNCDSMYVIRQISKLLGKFNQEATSRGSLKSYRMDMEGCIWLSRYIGELSEYVSNPEYN